MSKEIVFTHIERARTLYRRRGEEILFIPEMRKRLKSYDEAIENTQKRMRQAGVVKFCGLCAAKTGSCCFKEVETWYDPVLLLINYLMGVDLPHSRELRDQCLFLGNEGCRLRARYAFCLNYFCPSLKLELGSVSLHAALAAVGHELAAGWELERALSTHIFKK
ncbi:conserved hypothetical protein [delta proteobacterium NaphS2]|nr:conserved hypothetical protein [delta proteobacterium NaphS2]